MIMVLTSSAVIAYSCAIFLFCLTFCLSAKKCCKILWFISGAIGVGLVLLTAISPTSGDGPLRFLCAFTGLVWAAGYLVLNWKVNRQITSSIAVMTTVGGLLLVGLISSSWLDIANLVFGSVCISFAVIVLHQLCMSKMSEDSNKGE